MNILIEKIRIKNFRALRDVEVTLKPITILVGTNNSGKTTFLKALNSVFGFSKNLINKDDLFVDKHGALPAGEIIVDIKIIPVDEKGKRIEEFSQEWSSKLGGDESFLLENAKQAFALRTTYTFATEDNPTIVYRLFSDWETEQVQPDEFRKMTLVRNNIKMYFIDAQRDILEDTIQRTSFFGRLVSQLDYSDKLTNIEDQMQTLNNSAVEYSLALSHLKTELEKLNQTTQTQGAGVSINPFPKKISDLHKGMKVYFQDTGSDTFSMEYHGMGTRSWASIITAGAFTSWELKQIEQKKETGKDTDLLFPIFGLEEPEAHLHPNAQRTLYKQLKGFNGQKIISTHSPYIAGQADLEELRHFYKSGDSTVVSEIEQTMPHDITRKIKNEVIESKGEILFSKAIVIFEGQTEKLSLPIFAARYFNCSPFELGIFFTEANGNNYKPFIKLAQMLNIPWFIFSEYDKPNIKKGVDNALTDINHPTTDVYQVHKLGQSIEEYLISEEYQQDIKNGINAYYLESCDENTPQQQIEEGQKRVNIQTDSQLLELLKKDDSKVKFPTYWAKEISKREDGKEIPPKIKELFDSISTTLNLIPTQDE